MRWDWAIVRMDQLVYPWLPRETNPDSFTPCSTNWVFAGSAANSWRNTSQNQISAWSCGPSQMSVPCNAIIVSAK
eukprot:12983733-Ditylum_brightwellii.AAC.2